MRAEMKQAGHTLLMGHTGDGNGVCITENPSLNSTSTHRGQYRQPHPTVLGVHETLSAVWGSLITVC